MQTREAVVAAGGVNLAGTLTLPDRDSDTVVLMIHGSGPHDRNENIPGQALDIFNTLAADLAARDVASFRYDKRGCGASSGDFQTAGISDFTADAEAALAALRDGRLGTFRRVLLLGHSEGTIIAADIAGRDAAVAGLVLLAPFLQPMEAVLRAQAVEIERALKDMRGAGGWLLRTLSGLRGGAVAQQDRLIARVKSSDADSIRFGGRRIPAKHLRELMALDSPAIYAKVRVPTLLLGGGKDLQCDPEDVARIAAIIGPAARPLVVADLTHILRRDHGEHTLASYRRLLARPVDPAVLEAVGAFVAPPQAD